MSTQTRQDKKQIALAFVLIGAMLYVSYLLIAKFWSIFSTIDPKLGAGIVAASATIIVSLISVKVPTYEKIIDFIFSLTFAEKLGKKRPNEKEMIKFMAEVTQELVIWGSDEILFTVEDLLLAIRKDLGHKNKNMSKGKLLGLFANDLKV